MFEAAGLFVYPVSTAIALSVSLALTVMAPEYFVEDVVGETVAIRVDVSNLGRRAAEETVFLFVRDRVATVARPVLELKGVAKIRLDPGQTGSVTLMLPAAELRFPGADLEPVFEAGDIDIFVGPCADRSRLLTGSIQLAQRPAS